MSKHKDPTRRTVVAALAVAALTSSGEVYASEPHAERILSIGGDVTEILYALGLEDRIIAVDTTSQYPERALKTKPNVGYMRALSPEGVLSLGATLVLASKGAGPAEALRAIKASSVRWVDVPDEPTPEGILAKIDVIAKATGTEAKAAKLASALRQRFDDLARMRARVATPKRVLFILNAASGRLIVGGAGTSADAALKLAGAKNAAWDLHGFKPITAEGLVAMAPDAVLVMAGGRGGDTAAEVAEMPAFKLTPAGKSSPAKVTDINGSYLIGFGPRTPEAASEVVAWLYPDLKAD